MFAPIKTAIMPESKFNFIIMKHSIQVKVRDLVTQKLNSVLMEAQSIKNEIRSGGASEKAITEDFTSERLEANGVYTMVDYLEDEVKTIKMLLNLLK